MRVAQVDDLVLHNYHYSPDGGATQSYLCGFSMVAQSMEVRTDEPPKPGEWVGRGEYYRIPVKNFQYLDAPLSFSVFLKNYSERLRDEINYHKSYFFPLTINAGMIRPNQGMYLSVVTQLLYDTFLEALGVEEAPIPPEERASVHSTYAEGQRATKEVTFFTRNANLAEATKKHYDYTCQLCGYKPAVLFGDKMRSIGLDCHHLNPLSERSIPQNESTLADVTVLCANCHRLVHNHQPAMSLEQAKKLFRTTQT